MTDSVNRKNLDECTFEPICKNFWGSSILYVRKIFRKTNISYSLIQTKTCAYQGVRNVSFSKKFGYARMDDPLPCSRLLKVIVGLLPDERVVISTVKTI